MKKNNIFISVALVIFGMFAMQSCTQDNSPVPTVYKVPVLANPSPANASSFKLVGNSMDVTLTWEGTGTETPKWDVYFGTDPSNLTKVASQITGNSYKVTITTGATYYWYVYTIDKNKVYSKSEVWEFTAVQPIDAFVGVYTCDEPAEGWTYTVSFAKLTATTLQIGNGAGSYDGWWASWTSVFTLDFTNNTYSMPLIDFGGGYSGEESGTLDPATGTITGTYTVYKKGVSIETGTHTYTKQ